VRRARLVSVCALAVLIAGAAPCEDEERVRALEAERDALIESTVPKADLWAELERKGTALKETQPLEKERAAREARVQAETANEPPWQAQEEELRLRRGEVDAERAQLEAELAQAESETAQRSATLEEFAQRHRRADPGP
jgi:hypothetical protein